MTVKYFSEIIAAYVVDLIGLRKRTKDSSLQSVYSYSSRSSKRSDYDVSHAPASIQREQKMNVNFSS